MVWNLDRFFIAVMLMLNNALILELIYLWLGTLQFLLDVLELRVDLRNFKVSLIDSHVDCVELPYHFFEQSE